MFNFKIPIFRWFARSGVERADQPDPRTASLDFARGRVARKEDGRQARKGSAFLVERAGVSRRVGSARLCSDREANIGLRVVAHGLQGCHSGFA